MKKIILSLMLIFPLSLMAQDVKIGYVKFNEITAVMPEVAAMENELIALSEKYQAELASLEAEFNRKSAEFQTQEESLTENIKVMRIQEIEGIRERYENMMQAAQKDVEKKQDDLTAPINEKIMKAISEVGEENGLTCVLHFHQLLYTGKNCEDITEKVKKKLGVS